MAPSELRATIREHGSTVVIDMVGDVNGSAGDALDLAYSEAVTSSPTSIALNFEQTEFINSTGIALIVGVLARARTDRIEVRAFGLSAHYREIFEITRLADFMTIADDEAHAVGAERKESP